MNEPSTDPKPSRRLDFRSGGWLILLAVALVVFISAWRIAPMLRLREARAVGDGRDVASYGFDLMHNNVPLAHLAAAGFPKDGIPALDAPQQMPGTTVTRFNEEHRGKYLVSDDRVIGVSLGGESRAYPIRVMNWHEVVNDTVGGIPIAVTYHPLCDSVLVFDRRVHGETLSFGVSGLLFNSNLLLYDRRGDAGDESLWSQLLARAIAGPAAGARHTLAVLPASLSRWQRWLAAHPDTTVIEPDLAMLKRYARDPYGNYLRTGKLRFPVEPTPPPELLAPMEPVLAVRTDDSEVIVPVALAVQTPGAIERYVPRGTRISFEPEREPGSYIVVDPGDAQVIHALWFAWYAHYPESDDLLVGNSD
jgi:hypothetical protein